MAFMRRGSGRDYYPLLVAFLALLAQFGSEWREVCRECQVCQGV